MMKQGLSIWKDNGQDILLDADNLFWATTANGNGCGSFISSEILRLYENIKDKLTREINEFRFSQDLTAIYIDPTDRCNANCSYCYIPARIRRNGHSMSRDELGLILKKIARYFKGEKRKQVIIFHASEPLLVKKVIFEAIANYSKIFKFGLQTNAILLEKEDIKFLKDHFVGVGISLDSFLPSVNNRIRPSAQSAVNFSRVIRAIEWFAGYKGLNVITTVTKFNLKHLPGIVKFLHARRVPCVLLNPVRFTRASMRLLKPDQEDLINYFKKAVDAAIELSRDTGQGIIVGNFTNTVLAIVAPLARRLMCDISPCGGGRCFFTITARGEIIPCGEFIGLKSFSGGNIFNTAISKAMQSKAFKKIRERITEKIDQCNICDFRNICGAPCPAELHALGNMYQKSVFCDFYKEIIRYAFKLIAEDKVKYLLREDSLKGLKYAYNLNAI